MPDYLSCGSCPVDFELGDINSFIEHKKQRCTDNMNDNTDLLECNKCPRKFHTPWPLLIHVQTEHNIVVVRNLDQIKIPVDIDESNGIYEYMDVVRNDNMKSEKHNNSTDENKENNFKDVYTQTGRFKESSIDSSCCQTLIPPCCQKIEPQVCENPCTIICTSDNCFTDKSKSPDLSLSSLNETNKSKCCECPTIKKESREVQTDDIPTPEQLDLNFVLSNSDDSNHSLDRAPKFPPETTDLQSSNINLPDMRINWNYYPTLPNNLSYNNYMPTEPENTSPFSLNMHSYNPSMMYNNSNNSNTPLSIPHTATSPIYNMMPRNDSYQTLIGPSKNNLELPNSIYMNSSPLYQRNNDINMNNNEAILNLNNTDHNSSTSVSPTELDKVSSTAGDLNDDKKRSIEYKFNCLHCQKIFRQKVHLRKHIMSQHAHQKPHKCHECGYTTVEKSHLTVHIRTHTGERPYTCRRCSYSSAQNCTLKSHYLRRHPGDKISCNMCGADFITEQERNNHQRSCRIVNGNNNNNNSGGGATTSIQNSNPTTPTSSLATPNIFNNNNNNSNNGYQPSLSQKLLQTTQPNNNNLINSLISTRSSNNSMGRNENI